MCMRPGMPSAKSITVCETRSSQFKNNYLAEMCSGSEAGSYLRLIDFVSMRPRVPSARSITVCGHICVRAARPLGAVLALVVRQ